MKVVLAQDVAGLGKEGEEKEVKPGYGRNYLLLRGLAVLPNDPQAKELRRKAETAEVKKGMEESQAVEQANLAAGKVVAIKAKTGAKNQLFAAVGADAVKRVVKEQIGVEPEKVEMEPIKLLGDHTVRLQFGHGKCADVTVRIQAEVAAGKGK